MSIPSSQKKLFLKLFSDNDVFIYWFDASTFNSTYDVYLEYFRDNEYIKKAGQTTIMLTDAGMEFRDTLVSMRDL